jgi:integrase
VTAAREPLSAAQAKQLLRSAIDTNDAWATRWAAALLLGARQGEILGLQWSRLDLDDGIADFRWQLQQLEQAHGCGDRHSDGTWPCGKVRVGYCPCRRWDLPRGFEHQVLHRSLALTAPKTKAGTRIVPVPAPLWVMLKQYRGNYGHPDRVGNRVAVGLGADQESSSPNAHDLVWHHGDGRPISPRDDYDNWQTALKTAGLPPAPLHVARGTTATLLAEAGVPEDVRMQILGHVSVTAHRGYVYIDQTRTRDAMKALDQLLG